MKTRQFLLTTIISALLFSAGSDLILSSAAQAEGTDNRDVVHDARKNVIVNTFGNCVRTKWMSQNDECGTAVAQIHRVTHYQFSDEERTAYFEFDKSTLMGSERRKLASLASTLKSMNDISGVSIVGYADRVGSARYNESLSEKRAKVVEGYLKEHGYLNTTIAKTRWLGESVPITQCSDKLGRSALITCLQADRRVTVEIQYKEDESYDTITN